MSDDYLNREYFKKLFNQIPAFKKQVAEKHVKSAKQKLGKATPCAICGKWVKADGVIVNPQMPRGFCDDCKTRLDEGQTALVNMEGTRFIFADFKAEDMKDFRGKVRVMKNETLDKVEQQNKQNGNNSEN